MPFPSARLIFLMVFLTCTGMMAFGYFLQYILDLEPCPLCITQRAFIVSCGLIALLGSIHGPGPLGIRIYGYLVALFAIAGGGFSTRQVYLQSLPPELAPACGPNIEYILETFPLVEALEVLLRGNGDCAEVLLTFLGLSIPGWTLVAFTGLALMGLFAALLRALPGPGSN
jgi:disulfide bond formation protein DsbB